MSAASDDWLIQEIAALPPSHRIVFAASCSERLIPNYAAFSRMEGWGDTGVLLHALNAAWDHIAGMSLSEPRVRELLAACERIAPDTEDFSSIYTSAALDATTAIIATLECCLAGDIQSAAHAAQSARDT